jgi:hypothetical protein
LRDGNIAGDAHDGRVVVGAVTDDKIPQPFLGREFCQDGVQVILTQLARSTAGGGEGGERRIRFDLPLHGIEGYRPKALTEPFGSVVVHRLGLDLCGQLVGFKEAK